MLGILLSICLVVVKVFLVTCFWFIYDYYVFSLVVYPIVHLLNTKLIVLVLVAKFLHYYPITKHMFLISLEMGIMVTQILFLVVVSCIKYSVYTLPIQKRRVERRFWDFAKLLQRSYFGKQNRILEPSILVYTVDG